MTLTINTELADDDLVAAVRAGDDDAFGTLFFRYRDELVRYVARMVSGGPDQAEDCIQDVFASALQSLRASDRPVAFKPWIYRIAKNACIDRHRRGSRYTSVSLDTAELGSRDESRLQSVEGDPEIVAEQRQTMASLRNAFDGLEDSHHEILVLREFEGESYDKISNQMGLSPAAVQSALFRARRRLQSEYEEIATGKRCELVRSTLDEGTHRIGGVRKKRKVISHLRDCGPCRRHAGSLGMSELLAESASKPSLRERAAALLPLPFGLGAQKLAVGAAGVALLIGGGVATKQAGIGPLAKDSSSSKATQSSAGDSAAGDATSRDNATRKSDGRSGSDKRSTTNKDGKAGTPAAPTDTPNGSAGSGSGASGTGNSTGKGGSQGNGDLPSVTTPSTPGVSLPQTPSTGEVLDNVHNQVGSVGSTIGGSGLPGSQTAGGAVDDVNDTVNSLGKQVTGPLDEQLSPLEAQAGGKPRDSGPARVTAGSGRQHAPSCSENSQWSAEYNNSPDVDPTQRIDDHRHIRRLE